MIIIAQPQEWIGQMVAYLQGMRDPWGNYTALALVSDAGEFRAGVIYNNFEARNVCMHVSIHPGGRLTPAFIRAAFDYPFNQLGKERVTALCSRRNKKAVRFVRRLGFQYEGCLRRYYGHTDMMVYGLLRDEAMKKGLIAEQKMELAA